MSSMQAVQLVEWQSEPEVREVPVPEPGPGQVLLEVQAAGLCHTDLHVMEWPEGYFPVALPFTLGHENAGRVVAVGAGVTDIAEGEAMLVYGPWGCGRCRRCASGLDTLCERLPGAGGGLGYDGGLAKHLLVPSPRHLIPLGDLDPAIAAPLSDAALTPYHAVKAALPSLWPGADVVVIGVGGLGHVAIQILRALAEVRITAIDVRPEALALARRAGADITFDSSAAEPDDIRAGLGAGGAALVLDLVGLDATLALAARLLGVGGHVAMVGAAGGTLPVSFEHLPLEASVSLPLWGSRPELIELMELARAGRLDIEVERLPLERALEGYDLLRRGEIVGRAVVTP